MHNRLGDAQYPGYLTGRLKEVIELFCEYTTYADSLNSSCGALLGFTTQEEEELAKHLAIFSQVLGRLKDINWSRKSPAEKHQIMREHTLAAHHMKACGLLDPEGKIK